MNSFLKNKLLKFIRKNRKPYGHNLDAITNDLEPLITEIKQSYHAFIHKRDKHIIPIDEFSDAQKELNEDKKWKALLLFAFGKFNRSVQQDFKPLNAFINTYKKDITLVMFSLLEPKKTIKSHKGNNHGVLRLQIGIDIPEAKMCGLKVEDKTFHLKENDWLIFDDTFEHSAWNDGDKNRTILIIDIKKPLPFPYNILNNYYQNEIKHSAYITQAFKKLEEKP